jgi:putative ABC transport system permease protein
MQTLLQTLLQDLQYAVRQLWKAPGFALTAVLTLAIGIGVNTASFSIMDAVVLRPLAVPDLDRVVSLSETQNHGDPQQVALANFQDWRSQSHSFEELAVRRSADLSLTGAGDPAPVRAEYASPSFFKVLGTQAFLGRVFSEGETRPGGDKVAVLSYSCWKALFNSDPSVVGRHVELDRQAYTVIGVMPNTMQYPSTADFFVPFAPAGEQLANRASHDYLAIGRVRKGVTLAQAQSELNLISSHLSAQYPATNQGWSAKVEPLLAAMNGDLTPLYFKLIQGATFFVLLVVCANIANLQFARGIARRPEIAMRTALGAGRARLLRQLLTENILLGLIGGAGGLLFASLYMHISQASMPERVARYLAGWSNISLNGRALALSLLLAVVAGVVSGFAPALQALRVNLVEQLKSGSRAIAGSGQGHKLRNLLAIAQISLAVALVVGTALMVKGMLAMLNLANPYRPEQTLIFNVHLPAARYATPEKQSAQKQSEWYRDSLARIEALPGVERASVTAALPYSDDAWLDDCLIEGRPPIPGNSPSANRIAVSAGYFAAFHISIVSGRAFNQGDSIQSQPVAVVSRSFVARYFPGGDPLGHRIRMKTGSPEQVPWMTIVGVADEASYSLWDRSRPPAVYMDVAQLPSAAMTYAVATDGDPLALAPAVRKSVAALDPALPLEAVESYRQFMRERLTGMLYVAATLGLDAFIALLLAAIGIFGVMANLVGERTREIGVRLALGARREDVLHMVLWRAGWLTGTGVGVGLLLAFALAHGVANLLYEVSPNDPVVFGSITALIAAIAMLASWVPAMRAARVDPMEALRDE